MDYYFTDLIFTSSIELYLLICIGEAGPIRLGVSSLFNLYNAC